MSLLRERASYGIQVLIRGRRHLEDIDAINATHSRQCGTLTSGQDGTTSSGREKRGGKVSLSTLLNTIDGFGSKEGRLLIITTNHVERLDAALLRPGRVDTKLQLGLTTYDINAQLFISIFRSNISDKRKGAEKAEVVRLKKLEIESETELKALATDFARKVPENEFSPAEIQLLVGYRKSPAMAVQNVQEWVVKCRKEKRHVRRVDPWVSEERLRSDNDIAPSDKPTVSTTTQDDTRRRGGNYYCLHQDNCNNGSPTAVLARFSTIS